MRSGAVGINLTAANHVFILEPAMNPALEDQAVGRAFRMGQTRAVVVKKLYIKVGTSCFLSPCSMAPKPCIVYLTCKILRALNLLYADYSSVIFYTCL